MAQRRSRNRRLSARKSNVSGFLNEDTNVYDNNDPLWYDRTAVRPSTSLRMSKNTTAILDPDSTVHASQLTDDWFENLSQSESSKLLEEAMKKKTSQQHEELADSDHISVATESESEHEFQKKRANLRSTRKQSNKIDKSNAFMKALEKTTDSHTRNLTHAQMMEGNESESTHDDSRTIRKLRPKFTRRVKNDTNNFDRALESDSTSERVETSRRSLRSTSKRISEINEEFATPEKQMRLTRSIAEKIDDESHGKKSVEKIQNKSVNKSRDKTIAESSVKELRNRNIVTSPVKSATPAKLLRISSGTKKRSAEDQSPNSSSSSPNIVTSPVKSATPAKLLRISSGTKKRPAEDQSPNSSSSSPKVKKPKRQLFSQRNNSIVEKSKRDKSAFDAALDSVNDNQENEATITEVDSISKVNEQSKTLEDDDDDSDSSSIPQNIRRTRSRSLFGERNSDETVNMNSSKNKSRRRERDLSESTSQSLKDTSAANDSTAANKQNNPSKNKSKTRERSFKNASQSSKDQSAANKSTASDKQESTLKNLESDDDDEDIYNTSLARSEAAKAKSNGSENTKSRVSSVDTDSEDMVDVSLSKSKQSEMNNSDMPESDKLQVSSVETSDDEDMIDMPISQTEQRRTDSSKKSNESTVEANKSRGSKFTSSVNEDEEDPSNSELSKHKSRSRLFKKKNTSKEENVFDQISFNKISSMREKSKEKEIEDTPRLSQRSPKTTNKSQKNQSANASKNKSSSQENTENDSKIDESEDETSTIPQHIRRTRSRLFRNSKANDDDNAFEDALDVENVPESRSELSQKTRTLNKSANKSASIIRDDGTNKLVLEAMKAKPKIILNKITRPADSVGLSSDSPEKNQESRRSSSHKSVANSSLSKENPISNSQDAACDHRSIETSSDGTPDPASPKETSTPFTAPVLPIKPSKRVSMVPGSAKSAQNSTLDDLLHTPDPAQSTLNPHGKPLNRITQFSFRTFANLEEQTPPATTAEASKTRPNTITENNDAADVANESEISDCPLLSRQADDIPSDKDNSQVHEVPVISKSSKNKSQSIGNIDSNNENVYPIDWEKARQHTDAVKMMVEAQMRLAEEDRKKRELEKQRIDVKVKRLQAQREAELKRKNKKPIHKAYFVDGKLYKQPRLPRPKQWATDKLYKYLWKKMEPKFGIRTRVKSEEFVLQLSDFATRIARRKKFENYKHELDEIMMTMAQLGIINTRFDFYRFTVDFLPYDIRAKVNPMMMPGNERNIPYEPELLHKPLLSDSRNTQETDTDDS